jgi:N-acetylglucosamine kinase-like BadF-type ATPase
MAYFLAVDGGGTKTDFLLADESRELGRVRTGSIKRLRLDAGTTAANLRRALSDLEALTNVSMRSVTRCCIGAGGETAPTVAAWIRETFGRLIGGELLLLGDVEIALEAAFPGRRGVLTLAGTGSQIAGRGSDGVLRRTGGYGPAISDEGSGHFLGSEGLRKAFRAIDEERPTLLLEAFQTYWELGSLGELIEFANRNPAPDFSLLAPLVVKCSDDGDEVAAEVIRRGGEELAALTVLVIEQIRRAEAGSGKQFVAPPVALAGSILEKVPLARQALDAALRARYPEIEVAETATDPVQGALWRARRGF